MATPVKTLIWTRGLEDWPKDSALLEELLPADIQVEHIPCVRLTPVEFSAPLSRKWTHFVFTSAHAVTYALADAAFKEQIYKSKNIYTHGASTAVALVHLGLAVIRPPGIRTARELGSWLASQLPHDAKIIVPGPKEPAFDLAPFLARQGFRAEALACYETEAKAHLPDGTALSSAKLKSLTLRPDQVICFASPSSVQGFLRGAPGVLAPAAVIGPTTGDAAKGFFTPISVAAENTLTALVQAAIAAFRTVGPEGDD